MADLEFNIVALDRASQTFVRMAEQIERLSERLERLDGQSATVRARVDDQASNPLQRILATLGLIDGKEANVRVKVDQSITQTLNDVARLGQSLQTLAVPGAMAAGIPVLLGLAAAARDLSGVVGIAAGGMAAAATVAGTLKLGLSGVSDAMGALAEGDAEKFNEALAKMAPNAQAAMRELWNLRPAFDAMRLDVQQALFRGLAEEARQLGGTYLPLMRGGLTGVAGELNVGARSLSDYLTSAKATSSVATIFEQTRLSVAATSNVGASLVSIFLDVASVGSTFLPSLATGFGNAAERAAAFVARAKETGALAEWMQKGLDTLRQLGDIAGNVGAILSTMMQAAQETGGGLLGTLQQITGALRTAFQSPAGYELLIWVFETISILVTGVIDIVMALLPALSALAGSFGYVAGVLVQAVVPVVQALAPLLTMVAELIGTVLVPVIEQVAPVFLRVAQALTAALLPVLPVLVDALSMILVAITPLIFTLETLAPIFGVIALAAAQVIMALAPLINLLANAFQQVLAALVPVIARLATILADLLVSALNMIMPLLPPLIDSFIGVVSAVSSVLPPLMEMGAIIVGALLPVLPQLAQLFIRLIEALLPLLPPLLQIIQLLLPVLIQLFNALMPVIMAVANTLVTVLAWTINSVIVPALNLIIWTIQTFLIPIFNAFMEVARVVFSTIGSVISTTWSLTIKPVWEALGNFITGVLGPVLNFLRTVVENVWSFIGTIIRGTWENFIRPSFDALRLGLDIVRGAFENGVTSIGAIWERLKRVIATPVEAVIRFVYNDGIVKMWNWVADKVGLGNLKLEPVKLPLFAEGGPVMGGGRKKDQVLARLGHNEHVWTDDEVDGAGGHGNVMSLRRRAREGQLGSLLDMLNKGTTVEGADHDGAGSRTSGFGGVKPHVAQAGHYLARMFGIGSVGGVGSRPNASDHPKGLALDFMTRGENGTRLANHVIANKGHFKVTYAIWQQKINNGSGWRPMADRGGDTANHFDHVHVSFGHNGTATGEVGDTGGGFFDFDPVSWILEQFGLDIRSLVGKLGLGGDAWSQILVGAGGKMVSSVWDAAVSKISEWFFGGGGGGGGGGAGVERWRGVVGQALGLTGQPTGRGMEDTVLRRMNQESGGDPNVVNRWDSNWARGTPSVGLMQVIGPTFAANAGQFRGTGPFSYGVSTNPLANTYASMRYALGRYGSLPAAYNRVGGYANGAFITSPTFGLIGEDGPEVILPLTRPARTAELMEQAGLRGRGGSSSTDTMIAGKLDELITLLRDRPQFIINDESGDPVEVANRILLNLRLPK